MPAAGVVAGLLAVLLRAWSRDIPFTDLAFVSEMPWWLLIVAALGATLLLAALCLVCESDRPVAWALLGGWMAFAFVLSITADASVWFSLGLCAPLFFIVNWMGGVKLFARPRIQMKHTLPIVTALFVLMTAAVAWVSILRYRTYSATTFDLGIFAQMFESMRRTGHAWTTLERGGLMTHFGVHCSPFYYLLLPFYACVPRVETLLVLQAAGVGAGLFAVRAIAKQCFGAAPRCVLAACLLYLLHPAFGFGCVYDFHENKFLAPLLLWAFYFLLRGKMLPLAIFAVLVLSVKEDAAIYIIALALYMLFVPTKDNEPSRRKRVYTALSLLALSVVWFLAAAAVVRHYGEGVMVSRLKNYFLDGGGGFADVLKVFVSNPGYVIREMFTREKAEFLLYLFLPLGFAPLPQRRGAAWLLLLPVLAINLASNYSYQYTMGFQYAYGPAALALALALVTLAESKPALRRRALLFAVCASLLCSSPLFLERAEVYSAQWAADADVCREVDRALAALPPGAEITGTTWFPPHLSGREAAVRFYPSYGGEQRITEYFLCKAGDFDREPGLEEFLQENYIFLKEEGFVRIYRAIWV